MKYNGNCSDFRIFDEPKPKMVVRKNQKNSHRRTLSLSLDESAIKHIQKLSLDQNSALLTNCIKLVQRQYQELREKYLQEEKNARILKKLHRKLKRHKADSLLLKNYSNGLKKTMNHQEWGNVTAPDKRPMLQSQLTFIQVLAEDNLKDTSQCIGVIEDMMTKSSGYGKCKRERPRSITFEEAMDQFFKSFKTSTTRDQKTYIIQPKEGSLPYKNPGEGNPLLPDDENRINNNKKYNKLYIEGKNLVKPMSPKNQTNKYLILETPLKEVHSASQNLIKSTDKFKKETDKEGAVEINKNIQKITGTRTFKIGKKQKISISKNQLPKSLSVNRLKSRDIEHRSLGNKESKSNSHVPKTKVISKINDFHNQSKNEKLNFELYEDSKEGNIRPKEHLRYAKVKVTESQSSYRSIISVKPLQKHHDSHHRDHKDYKDGSLKVIPREESKKSLSSKVTVENEENTGSGRTETKSERVKFKKEKRKKPSWRFRSKKAKPMNTDKKPSISRHSWKPRRNTNLMTLDVERMGHMIKSREVPTEDKDLQLLQKYERDPQQYNILILSLDKDLSDAEYEKQIPVLQRNYEYIRRQLEENARRKRILERSAKHQDPRKAEDEPEGSGLSADSCHYSAMDFNADYLAHRRAIWAEYIATQPKTPTEALLADMRRQKLEANEAKRAEERRQELKHKREMQRARRSLSALYRAPRQTHRLRQAIQEIQDELKLEVKATSPPSLTRPCSRCFLACSQKSCETLDSLKEILAQFRS